MTNVFEKLNEEVVIASGYSGGDERYLYLKNSISKDKESDFYYTNNPDHCWIEKIETLNAYTEELASGISEEEMKKCSIKDLKDFFYNIFTDFLIINDREYLDNQYDDIYEIMANYICTLISTKKENKKNLIGKANKIMKEHYDLSCKHIENTSSNLSVLTNRLDSLNFNCSLEDGYFDEKIRFFAERYYRQEIENEMFLAYKGMPGVDYDEDEFEDYEEKLITEKAEVFQCLPLQEKLELLNETDIQEFIEYLEDCLDSLKYQIENFECDEVYFKL